MHSLHTIAKCNSSPIVYKYIRFIVPQENITNETFPRFCSHRNNEFAIKHLYRVPQSTCKGLAMPCEKSTMFLISSRPAIRVEAPEIITRFQAQVVESWEFRRYLKFGQGGQGPSFDRGSRLVIERTKPKTQLTQDNDSWFLGIIKTASYQKPLSRIRILVSKCCAYVDRLLEQSVRGQRWSSEWEFPFSARASSGSVRADCAQRPWQSSSDGCVPVYARNRAANEASACHLQQWSTRKGREQVSRKMAAHRNVPEWCELMRTLRRDWPKRPRSRQTSTWPNDMGICNRRHFLLTICVLQLVSPLDLTLAITLSVPLPYRHLDTRVLRFRCESCLCLGGSLFAEPACFDTLSSPLVGPRRPATLFRFRTSFEPVRTILSTIPRWGRNVLDYHIFLSIGRAVYHRSQAFRRNW